MRPLGSKPFVAHVFLVDPGDGSGLILVDTGFGMADVANPKHRLGLSRFFLRPDLDVQHTAVQQLASRGIDPGDVARDVPAVADRLGGFFLPERHRSHHGG